VIGIAAQVGGGCTISPSGVVSGLCNSAKTIRIPIVYSSFLPVLILIAGAMGLLVISSVLPKRSYPGLWAALTALLGTASAIASAVLWSHVDHHGAQITVGGQIAFDHFSVLFMLMISLAVVLSALVSDGYLRREGLDGPEGYALMLLSASGGMLMAESAGLIMMFIGLEILSLALYVMAAYHRRREQSGEAGIKYFVLGSVSSAIFLYGVALVYGATGSTQFADMATFLANNHLSSDGILLAGMGMLIVGLGFKVAAVPFHAWSPDVYQGSPTPFTGFMAAVAKAAGFAGLIRILMSGLSAEQVNWRPVIWVLAVLSLLVGGVLAVVQQDIKRMMAYSSINHAGYMLVGLQAASARGVAGTLYYLFIYTFIIIGTFAVIGVVQGRGEADNQISSFRGLVATHPWMAAGMTVFLLAQAGVPLTTGFLAKFYVVAAAVQKGQDPLAVIAMAAAAITGFFYLRIILYMFSPSGARSTDGASTADGYDPAGYPSDDVGAIGTDGQPGGAQGAPGPGGPLVAAGRPGPLAALSTKGAVAVAGRAADELDIPAATAAVIAACALFTLVFGVLPQPLIDLANRATLIF